MVKGERSPFLGFCMVVLYRNDVMPYTTNRYATYRLRVAVVSLFSLSFLDDIGNLVSESIADKSLVNGPE